MKSLVARCTLLVLALTPGLSVAQCAGTVKDVQTLCECTGRMVDTTVCSGEAGKCYLQLLGFFCDSGEECGIPTASHVCLSGSNARIKGQDLETSIPTCGGAPLFSPSKWVDIETQDRLSIASAFRKSTF
jgi:hypothetical protein